jgi:hypothetical protein
MHEAGRRADVGSVAVPQLLSPVRLKLSVRIKNRALMIATDGAYDSAARMSTQIEIIVCRGLVFCEGPNLFVRPCLVFWCDSPFK